MVNTPGLGHVVTKDTRLRIRITAAHWNEGHAEAFTGTLSWATTSCLYHKTRTHQHMHIPLFHGPPSMNNLCCRNKTQLYLQDVQWILFLTGVGQWFTAHLIILCGSPVPIYPSPLTRTQEVNSSITFGGRWTRPWDSLALTPLSAPLPEPLAFPQRFQWILIISLFGLSWTGANGTSGQDFRIHHGQAEELAWSSCISCQSCHPPPRPPAPFITGPCRTLLQGCRAPCLRLHHPLLLHYLNRPGATAARLSWQRPPHHASRCQQPEQ